jgi:endonuclease/exonuclease/phosphatase family metal-dependent hydrolase
MGWDAACTRMVSWVKLKEVNSNYEFFFFNTHFDHMGEEAKKQSALLLSEKIRTIARLQPLVITGDFNSNEDSEPYKIMTRLFEDARDRADKKVESMPTTYLGFPADITETNIIDHIFVSPHFGVKEYEIAADNSGGYFPSDHLPVWTSLELRMP